VQALPLELPAARSPQASPMMVKVRLQVAQIQRSNRTPQVLLAREIEAVLATSRVCVSPPPLAAVQVE
jgi:hypothetical protein